MNARIRLAAGLALIAVLALTPLRALLEGSMRAHMLVQFPLVALTGAAMASAVPVNAWGVLRACNAHGLTGLTLIGATAAVLMIPRVLDAAIAEPGVEGGKFLALVLAGMVSRVSWQAAGPVVQSFYVGTMLPMSVAVGSIYQETPLRLCNAYRLDDQQRLGTELVVLASAMALLWLGTTLLTYLRGTGAPRPLLPR